MPHFRNLTNIFIILPTVKFLRGFAKTMATTGPESFQHLSLKIQFDFASSLESCILDGIVKPSEEEIKQIELLKAYPHWKDYVKENQIEVPEEDPEEEDPNKFCGLGVLFKNLKTFSVSHLRRTLRLPKGPSHWIDDAHPEFTNI